MMRDTLRILGELTPQELPVPADFASKVGQKIPVELSFSRFSLAGVGELRWTSMQSARADILAVMIFPNDSMQLPIFAAEFVVLGGKCKAAVVDLQSASPDAGFRPRVAERLRDLAVRYAELRSDTLPDWCRDHFTDEAIAALGCSVDDLDHLLEGYRLYLTAYLQFVRDSSPTGSAKECRWLRHYKDHHIEHTPGRPFMTAAYGAEWTERFLREGMYA
ncbi:hypothetical protein GC173_17685 [bacterium]|nr:hypothetical protein [bacterium]